jgi:hypothetical protein
MDPQMHPIEALWRWAGRPAPTMGDGSELVPRRPRPGTVCAATGAASPVFGWSDIVSTNFTTPKLADMAFPFLAESRIEVGRGRLEPAFCDSVAWAMRELAFRAATWIFDGDELTFCPMRVFPRGDKAKVPPETLAACYGGRTCIDYLDWLLRPRPPGTIAGFPVMGIGKGGESNFHRLPWPSKATEDPLVKLQSKHVIIYAQAAQEHGVLRLQVDDAQEFTLRTAEWRPFIAEIRELVLEVMGMMPERARFWSIARKLVEEQGRGAPPKAMKRIREVVSRNTRLVNHPWFTHMMGALYAQEQEA